MPLVKPLISGPGVRIPDRTFDVIYVFAKTKYYLLSGECKQLWLIFSEVCGAYQPALALILRGTPHQQWDLKQGLIMMITRLILNIPKQHSAAKVYKLFHFSRNAITASSKLTTYYVHYWRISMKISSIQSRGDRQPAYSCNFCRIILFIRVCPRRSAENTPFYASLTYNGTL